MTPFMAWWQRLDDKLIALGQLAATWGEARGYRWAEPHDACRIIVANRSTLSH